MEPTSLYNEKDLLRQVAAGDEKAFRAIYDQYRKKIASFAFLLTQSEDITDEIVQQVFVKLWTNRGKLKEVAQFNAWLHTITRNLVVDGIRKAAREAEVRAAWVGNALADANFADHIIFSREHEKLLQEAVGRLTPQQREIYRLSREQGLKHDEIAARLGISALTVKNHLVHAMRSIREHFRLHVDLLVIVACLGPFF